MQIKTTTEPRATDTQDGLDALRAISGESYQVLLRIARKIAPDGETAKDRLHDALGAALSLATTLKPDTNLRAWIHAVILNREIDDSRRRVYQRSRQAALVADFYADRSEPCDDEPKPQWQRVSSQDLRLVLGTLTPRARRLLVLHHVERCSYREIADRLNIRESTVGTALHRARRLARSRLLGQEPVANDDAWGDSEPRWPVRARLPGSGTETAGVRRVSF